jgi:hypothetical protein
MKNQKTTKSVTYEISRDHQTGFRTVDHQANYGAEQTDEKLSDEIGSQEQKTKRPYGKQSSKR